MRVLVTGGAGFIGRYVCKELWAQGHEPLVFDIAAPIPQDVRQPGQVQDAMRHADACIHLAGILGNPETVSDPYPCVQTNILGSLNVFEAAGSKPVVFPAVGNKWLRETGTGGYTITKSCVEDFIAMYNKCRGSTIAIVRPVNCYGPGQKVPAPWGPGTVRKIMPTFIAQALHGQDIEVYGNGSHTSDMVYVTDVARNIVGVLGTNGVWGIGPIESHTVLQVAKMVEQEVYNQTGVILPHGVVFRDMPTSEVPGVTALHETMWEYPRVDLVEGIALTVASYLPGRER